MSDTTLFPATPHPILAIASGKGGVGKTWMSVTLADQLARKGKRVLLFDGDIGLANVDVQLGLTPNRDLAHFFGRGVELSDVITSSGTGKGKPFDIIAGRSGSQRLASLPPAQITRMTNALLHISSQYDMTILDLAAGVDAPVRALADMATGCAIVVTDEPTSLTDSYAFIKLAHKARHNLPLGVIINQAENYRAGEKTYQALKQACQNFLGFTPPLLGIVRRDPQVKTAIRHQSPLMQRAPACPAAQDVEHIATALMTSIASPGKAAHG